MVKRILTEKMIMATLLATVFFSIAHPCVHKYLMMHIPEQYLAMETIIINIGVIVVNYLFDKKGDKLYKLYPWFLLFESILYTSLVVLLVCGVVDAKVYFIGDVFIRAIITRNIMCCANRLKRIVYEGESREKFDITTPVACAIACCIGSSIALFTIPLWLGWICISIGVSIDNLFYYLAYRETK